MLEWPYAKSSKLALILPFWILEGFIYNPRVTLLIFHHQFSQQLNFGIWIDFVLLILNISVNPFVRSHFIIVYSIISVPVDVQCFASGKGIKDSLGFWIPHCGFRIPGTLFQYLSVELGFWIPIVSGIPDFVSCIPDSKSKILPDSGFPYMWGERSDFSSLSNHKDNVSGKKLPPKISLRSFKLYRVHLASLYL